MTPQLDLTIYQPDKAYPGYTLFAPNYSEKCGSCHAGSGTMRSAAEELYPLHTRVVGYRHDVEDRDQTQLASA